MRILVGDKGHVDFDGAVELTEKQREDFILMLRRNFAVVHVEDGEEYRHDRIGDRLFAKPWDPDELRILLEMEDNWKVSEMLGRSWLSVNIKRGFFYPDFMVWAGKKGHNIVEGDLKKLIEEFLRDKKVEQKKRRMASKPKKVQVRELQREKRRLEKAIGSIKIRISCGQKAPGDDEKIQRLEEDVLRVEGKIAKLRGRLEV